MTRRGIATLELVLVFPMLLAIVAALFIMGRAILRKESVASTARNKAWMKRQQARPGGTLKLNHDPMESEVFSRQTKTVKLGSVFRGQTTQAESRNHVIGRTWTHEDVPFRAGQGPFRVHQQELTKMAVSGVGAALGGGLSAMALAMNPGTNPLMIAATIAGTIANPIVQFAGWSLKYPITFTVQAARIVVKSLEIAAWASFQWGLARRLRRIGNLMGLAIECFDNLYEASRGRPGRWRADMVRRLQESRP